jgi:hypothetical protein
VWAERLEAFANAPDPLFILERNDGLAVVLSHKQESSVE